MERRSEFRHQTFERGSIPWTFRGDPVRRRGGGRCILVVEDDVVLADQVSEAIAAMGFEPFGPASALEPALAFAETQELHGALLDVRLQLGLRVYPVAAALRQRRIPFCFMTAYCDRQMSEFGAETVLYKPFSLLSLRAAIHTMIEAWP